MDKLPLDHPTDNSNVSLIKKSLRAEKLDLCLRYRLLICLGILLLTSVVRTAFSFGFIGTILVTLPFFVSCTWAFQPSSRVKRAKRIPFSVLCQYISVIPKKINGHYVSVYGLISYINRKTRVVHLEATDHHGARITVALAKVKPTVSVITNTYNDILDSIEVGDKVMVAGEVCLQKGNGGRVGVLWAHLLEKPSTESVCEKSSPDVVCGNKESRDANEKQSDFEKRT